MDLRRLGGSVIRFFYPNPDICLQARDDRLGYPGMAWMCGGDGTRRTGATEGSRWGEAWNLQLG